MSDFLYWFKFWKQSKSAAQAFFHGMLAGCAISFVIWAPLWIPLIEVRHG